MADWAIGHDDRWRMFPVLFIGNMPFLKRPTHPDLVYMRGGQENMMKKLLKFLAYAVSLLFVVMAGVYGYAHYKKHKSVIFDMFFCKTYTT